ncbi:hypothetical protein WD_0607 [Wolbachia endosymbiont of Drosophila melanogaster]|nr:hypothetical protein WD_0607 [Wolbachia endosymbiont of Drosophila melanogaster]ACN95345.1 hypothetical protein WRi_005680 [Wolbachia sp. wRi]ACN95739.1 hypothetical protein WRi_010340 [Wolbachia sp. wRi]
MLFVSILSSNQILRASVSSSMAVTSNFFPLASSTIC